MSVTSPQPIEIHEERIALSQDFEAGRTHFSTVLALWQERKTILKAIAIGMVVGITIALLIPPEYQSTVRLMPPDQKNASSALALLTGGATGGSDDKMGALASQLLGTKTSGALFIGILGSRTVQDGLIDRFDLMHVYRAALRKSARERLSHNTEIEEDRKSGIISISVSDHSKQRAVGMASAYVEELDKVSAQMSTSSARREREFLEQRLVVVKQELDNSGRELSNFSTRNSTLDLTEQGKATISAAAELEGQLIATESQLAAMRAIYADGNVRVQALNRKASELRDQLVKIQGPANASAGAPPEPGDVIVPIRKLPPLALQYVDLYRRVKINEAVFETLTKQYELAKVEEAKEIPTVRVLDEPSLPETKASPHRAIIVLCGMLIATLGCIVYLIAYQRWLNWDVTHPVKSFFLHAREDLRDDLHRYRVTSWRSRVAKKH